MKPLFQGSPTMPFRLLFCLAVALSTGLLAGPCAGQAADKLRVMCWNIQRGANHFENGPAKALQVIRDSGAELLLLQESYDVDGDRPTLGRWMAGQLGWNVYQDKSPHLCIISRYPIEESFFHHDWHGLGAQIKLSERISIVAFSIWIDYRSYVPDWLRDHPQATDADLLACETEKSDRLKQAQAIVEYLKSSGHFDSRLPLLVGGDWNCPSHLDWTAETQDQIKFRRNLMLPVSGLMRDQGFRDLYREFHPDPVANPGNTWSPLYRSDDAGAKAQDRIDRIYYRVNDADYRLRPQAALVLPRQLEDERIPEAQRVFPSDHGAVVVDLQVQKIEPDGE